MNLFQKLLFVGKRLPEYSKATGGYSKLLQKAGSTVLLEGINGVKSRIINFESRNIAPPQMTNATA